MIRVWWLDHKWSDLLLWQLHHCLETTSFTASAADQIACDHVIRPSWWKLMCECTFLCIWQTNWFNHVFYNPQKNAYHCLILAISVHQLLLYSPNSKSGCDVFKHALLLMPAIYLKNVCVFHRNFMFKANCFMHTCLNRAQAVTSHSFSMWKKWNKAGL